MGRLIDDLDVTKIDSPTLRRLIEEVRIEEAEGEWTTTEDHVPAPVNYNRMHNRHNRSGGRGYQRMHNRHNRSR